MIVHAPEIVDILMQYVLLLDDLRTLLRLHFVNRI
jgi:hypothetical protein